MAPDKNQKDTKLPKGMAHVVTVGTTVPGSTADVVEALIDDLKGISPRKVVVLATEDSHDNAARLLKGIGLRGAKGSIRVLESAQSIDEAYRVTNEELIKLLADEIDPNDIILHYTGGTKVMSAGAVLAAMNHGIQSLRYLFSRGRNKPSLPIITPTAGVLVDREIRLSLALMRELRFRSARDIIASVDQSSLTPEDKRRCDLISELALAYTDWDNFRIVGFLDHYQPIHKDIAEEPLLADFLLSDRQLETLGNLSNGSNGDDLYPEELLLDLMNNAYRRLGERHTDDAMTRLHRAAELYAQRVLLQEHRIDTADVEIRKVPPRYRMAFEAERRMEDAKIKLGMRRSFELLDILGSDVGVAYREKSEFQRALHERRHLVLAHGTRAATTELALGFLKELETILHLRFKNLTRRLTELQFPWIKNREILSRLQQAPAGKDTVVSTATATRSKTKRRSARKPRS
ncbi:MAG: TIGR02710 family CRISPR-associated protein [Candidatus Sumerlaeia bacterium]|nr:TIGR02710 family CRISPR-associated protein [Candidatus Sumerlaeia bacterium]